MTRGALGATMLAAFLLATANLAGGSHVPLDEVIYVLPPDAIPAITEPRFSPDDWLEEGFPAHDPVLGVVVNGDARAYPLRILNWHEIVNDVVGGIPIAATFCPLCATGIVYERMLPDGSVLTFKVSGRLYKNDLVMYDAESGSESLWSQILGEAISGPRHGTKLELLPSATVPWNDFRTRYPDAMLLARPVTANGGFARDYGEDPYEGYASSRRTPFPTGNEDNATNLHPKEYALAVTVGERTRVYPYRFLHEERVVNDVLGETAIVVAFAAGAGHAFLRGGRTFTFDSTTGQMVDNRGSAWDPFSGVGSENSLTPVAAIAGFWFAIYDFEVERSGSVDVYRVGLAGQRERRTSSVEAAWALFVIPATVLIGVGVFYGARRLRHRFRKGV